MSEGKDFDELFKKIDTFIDMVLEKTESGSSYINETSDVSSSEECLSEKVINVTSKDSDGKENIWKQISNLL